MDKIELKNLLFLARISADEKEHPKIIEKLQNTFNLIDEIGSLDNAIKNKNTINKRLF